MAAISKAEYLQKYLSENAEEKKKKKRRKVPTASAKIIKSKIIDDDVDLKQLLPEDSYSTAYDNVEEDEPVIAEFIDERPEHVKMTEKYRHSGAWKLMGETGLQDAKHDSDLDQSPSRRKRHDSDSDQSPSRVKRQVLDSDQSPSRRKRHDSDSDPSPPRRKRHKSDSDPSPPRKPSNKKIDKLKSVPKKRSPAPEVNPHRKKSRFSDIDRGDKGTGRQSSDSHKTLSDRKVSRTRHDSDSDQSPRRKRDRHDSDSDNSPPRRKRQDSDSDQSPPRRNRRDLDSNQSPPRRKRNNSDSDQSPPRRKRRNSDSDQSPPRRNISKSGRGRSPPGRRRHNDSDSDLSPPRRSQNKSASGDKAEKTLGGKRAGLSSAVEMRREAQELRRKEAEKFDQIEDDKLGRGAATVFRDRKSGRRRDLDEERRQATEESRKKAIEDEKYKKWGQGMKQAEQQNQMTQEALHEADKPLARYRDDDDLDKMLREMDRAEDPMLAFIKKKKKSNEDPKKEKPRYKGPAPPPNRFGIPPGYRWDGVNRSNGFEQKVFMKKSNDQATASQAYKWSVEDM